MCEGVIDEWLDGANLVAGERRGTKEQLLRSTHMEMAPIVCIFNRMSMLTSAIEAPPCGWASSDGTVKTPPQTCHSGCMS